MLIMQLQIGFCDVVRIGHVVVDRWSSPPVSAGAVFLRPANCGVNRHICYVDACGISSLAMLWASPDLAWHAIAKAPLDG
jgi:hypothetical protein